MNSVTLVFFHLLLASALRLNSAGCPGCSSPVSDPNNGEIRKLMSSTLSKTNAGYSLTNIKSCTTQVVAGIKYDCEVDIKSPNGQTDTCRIVVVKRPWDQSNPEDVISESCSSVSRSKREVCAGCPVEQDANSNDMKKKLTGILSQTNSGLSLVNGVECTSQIVAGTKYVCTIQVESPKTNGVQTCKLSFLEQPWISKDPQILSDTCSQLVRNKREVCAGCPVEQDANSNEMKKKLTGILSQTNSGLSLVNGVECTSQVVAGTKYVCTIQVESPKTNGVQTCKLSFLEQPWISKDPQILSDTCSQLVRNKREVCAGCPVEQDANSNDMKKKLTGILSQTNSGLSLVNGVKCTSQIVAGTKYVCTIQVESPKTNGVQTCELSFLEQPWISKDPQVLSDSCSQLVRNKREICAGCPMEQDPSSPEMKKMLSKTLAQTNSGLGLVSVDKCTSQVVAGILYDCTIRVNSANFNGVESCRMQLLDQPWISKDPQVLTDTCSQLNNRAKRDLLGGLKDVDPSEKVLVQELATYAVKTLDDIDANNNRRAVIDIIKAQKQLVNGIMYHLKLRIRQTSCYEDKEINDECMQKDSAPQEICDIQVYRSFADKSPLNAKVVKSACEPVEDQLMTVGGYEPVQTNGDEVQKAAQFAAKKINEMVNSIYIKKIISIEKAETQVVSGMNYALTIELGDTNCMKNKVHQDLSGCKLLANSKSNLVCSVVVYEKSWENIMKLSSVHCQDVPNVSVVRAKRQIGGGVSSIDVNSPQIQGLNNYLGKEITQRTNSNNLVKVVKTLSATQQVVAGMLYNVKVVVATTKCPAAVNADPETCPLPNSPEQQECEVSVWDRPWLNLKEITSFNCQKHPDVTLTDEEKMFDEDSETFNKFAAMLNTDVNDVEFKQFATFLGAHNKVYKSRDEFRKRFSIFRANMKKVKYLQETEQGTGQYGATQFADLTRSEFKKFYLGFKKPEPGRWPERQQAVIPNVTLPLEYDWRDYGVVTNVKNQGACGSCWAFSVTGNVEGQYAIKNSQLLSLSEQELVDCDKYDEGCSGGYFDSAFHALEDLGGLETESDYPYEGYDDKCRFNSTKVKVTISSSYNISSNETKMAQWLYKNGPISVALNANAMQFYMGGVSHPLKFLCNPNDLDHGVLIVGFGVHKTSILKRNLPYWIVKNSWGPRWGKQGYYWLYRGDGSCGINQMPTTAVL